MARSVFPPQTARLALQLPTPVAEPNKSPARRLCRSKRKKSGFQSFAGPWQLAEVLLECRRRHLPGTECWEPQTPRATLAKQWALNSRFRVDCQAIRREQWDCDWEAARRAMIVVSATEPA